MFCFSGSKYEDNMEQVSGDGLSTAILNRNNPKHSQQTASTVPAATTTTSSSTVRNSLDFISKITVEYDIRVIISLLSRDGNCFRHVQFHALLCSLYHCH